MERPSRSKPEGVRRSSTRHGSRLPSPGQHGTQGQAHIAMPCMGCKREEGSLRCCCIDRQERCWSFSIWERSEGESPPALSAQNAERQEGGAMTYGAATR